MKHLFRFLFKNRGLGLLTLVFLLSMAPLSSIQAKKPIHTAPVDVLLNSGSVLDEGVWAGDDSGCNLITMVCTDPGYPVESFDVVAKSGKEKSVFIVVRHFMFTAEFAKSVSFYGGKYGDNDGLNCFGESDWVSGAYTLHQDSSAEFGTFPEFKTADGEAIQKYEFYLTGEHNFDLKNQEFPAEGEITVDLEFDRVEIGTEGKGQNRRRSCTGVFPTNEYPFHAEATITRKAPGVL